MENMTKLPLQAHIPRLLLQMFLVTIPLTVYTLILLNRSPNLLRPISLQVRFGFALPLIGLFLLFWGAYSVRGFWGQWISLTVTLAVFALSLAGLWASGETNSLIVSGLLPWSDAAGYYGCANLLLEGERYTPFCSSRPLFSGYLALILQLSQRNLALTVAVMTLIAGLCCHAAARAIRRTHGALPAALLLIVLFFYYRRYAGTTMSENLGLPLGALGFAILWNSEGRGLTYPLVGIMTITVGLLARLGPFFILPLLMIWVGWVQRGEKRYNQYAFGASAGIVILCMLSNRLIFQQFGSLEGALFSKVAPALYGVSVGGSSWAQVYEDHPEIRQLSDREQTQMILRLVMENARDEPQLFLKGVLKQYGYLFSNTWYSAYGYLRDEDKWYTPFVQYTLLALNAIGLISAWKKRHKPLMLLALALMAGMLLSVPFVPPGDTSQLRTYAVAIPVLGVMPGLGVSFLLEKTPVSWLVGQVVEPSDVKNDCFLSSALIVSIIAAPFVLHAVVHPTEYPEATCQPEMQTISVFLASDSSVVILPEKVFFLDWLPYFHQGRFERLLHGSPQLDFVVELENLETPATLFQALDLRTKKLAFVISPASLIPPEGGLLTLCGYWRESAAGRRYKLFDVVQVMR